MIILLFLLFNSLDRTIHSFRQPHRIIPSKPLKVSTSELNEKCAATKNIQTNFLDKDTKNIVIIAGFENFNFPLYRKAAEIVTANVPSVRVDVFTDRDILERPDQLASSLETASVLFCSLLFDYAQVQWILSRIPNIPTRFCFESALELMSETKVGEFNMKPSASGASGPPAPVKAILKQFGSQKEEDKMTGYLSFLKVSDTF